MLLFFKSFDILLISAYIYFKNPLKIIRISNE